MDSAHPKIDEGFLSLKQAAETLAVSVDTLLEWNNNNILKPTITQSGDVGYRKEQIDKFMEIQKLIRNPNTGVGQSPAFLPQNTSGFQKSSPTNNDPAQTGHYKNSNETKTPNSYGKKGGKFQPIVYISSFSAIAILITVVLFTQQGKTNPFTDQHLTTSQKESVISEKISVPQINQVNLSGTLQTNIHQPTGNIKISQDLSNNEINDPEDNLTALYAINNKEINKNATNNNDKISIVPQPKMADGTKVMANSLEISGTNNNLEILTSRPNLIHTNTSTPSDLLAIDLGVADTVQNNPSSKQKTLPVILISFTTFALLSLFLTLKKDPAYSFVKTDTKSSLAAADNNAVRSQKILEIDQKADGTVVIYFQGREHKISKPELNSESDQFIERLLGSAPENAKEISYDILDDEKLSLNAPLSKLVTRLGFVGLKRELFFPRTSKNSVFFRKYLTQEDLTSMSLTENQITNELRN
jgi:hypothetical protein